jgi:hypothetical protein
MDRKEAFANLTEGQVVMVHPDLESSFVPVDEESLRVVHSKQGWELVETSDDEVNDDQVLEVPVWDPHAKDEPGINKEDTVSETDTAAAEQPEDKKSRGGKPEGA